MFHKKINELKVQVQEAKKTNKTLTKEVEKELRQLSAAVLGPNDKSSIFIGATTIKEQFAELGKEIIKCSKKEVNQVINEKEAIIYDLKLTVSANKLQIEELNSAVEKAKKEKSKNNITTNGYSGMNKSNSLRSES
jgi:hypothetical protein